jgi:O-antigen ligase
MALFLGLGALWYLRKRGSGGFLRIAVACILMLVVVAGLSLTRPDVASKTLERASTTLDRDQKTYVGRWENAFRILRASAANLIVGIQYGERESRIRVEMEVKYDYYSGVEVAEAVVPHNLILEWIYYYGAAGLVIGIFMMGSAFAMLFGMVRKDRETNEFDDLGICAFSSFVFNLFFALCNPTTSAPYDVFFLYLPVAFAGAVQIAYSEKKSKPELTIE